MRLIHCLAALGLLAAAAPTLAQKASPAGVYLATDIGRAAVSSSYADDDSDATLSAAIGYQFSPTLAAELYTRGLSLTPLRGAFAEPGYYPDRHAGVSLIASTRLNDRIRWFGRAGMGRTTMKSNRVTLADRHQNDPILGTGVGYDLSRNCPLNVEAGYLTKSEVTLLTFGARLQF